MVVTSEPIALRAVLERDVGPLVNLRSRLIQVGPQGLLLLWDLVDFNIVNLFVRLCLQVSAFLPGSAGVLTKTIVLAVPPCLREWDEVVALLDILH